MLSTTVLRKFSWQWRILAHHAVKVQADIVSLDAISTEKAKGAAAETLTKQTSEGTDDSM